MSLLRLRLGSDAHLDLMAQLRRRDVSNFIPTCHISAPRARTLPDIHWSIFSACRRLHVPVIRTKSPWSTQLQNHSTQRPFNAGRMSSLFHLFVFCWKHFHWCVSRLTYGDVYVALRARMQPLVILGRLFHHLYSIFHSKLQFEIQSSPFSFYDSHFAFFFSKNTISIVNSRVIKTKPKVFFYWLLK